MAAAYRVNQADAVRRKAAVDHCTERPVVGQPDVLEHADGNEGVAALTDRAVVVLDERYLI